MRVPGALRLALAAGGFFVLSTLAACANVDRAGPSEAPLARSSNVAAMLTAADIIVPGADAGAFVNPIVPDLSGWLNTEFWDNPSDDGANCNVGFWATGVMPAGCTNAAPGSTANQGGYTRYWGNGPVNRKTSSFRFSGSYAYRITLLASYAGQSSEIGWFTVAGGVYTFHKLWDTKAINDVVLLPPTGGLDWGFYLRHAGHLNVTTCAVDTDCSDATGDMHAGTAPTQQFALFTNNGETRYLVGIEDNEEAVPSIGDDDFQDFIISVEPLEVPMFVVGDVEPHGLGDVVNFWGPQWWQNNAMSGFVANGVAAFKGYAATAGNYCGGTWSTLPGNSANPPATIPPILAIIVTSTVGKAGAAITGTIQQILLVEEDGGYGPSPGHRGSGVVTSVVCTATNGTAR